MVYSARSDAATRSQFTRRKKVTITTDGTSTPANYQILLNISYEPGMQADFDDIRFNTLSVGYIDYWIESYTASTTATVWIKLPDAITHPGGDTVWMYYGNSGLSNGSVGTDVFPDLFKDFESDDLSDWTKDVFTTFETSTDFAVSGSKSLKVHFNGSGAKLASLPLTNLDSDHAIDFDFIEMTGGDYPVQLTIDDAIKAGNGLRIGSFIYDDGGFDYLDRTPAWQSIATGLSVSTWYHISINPDVGTDLFDLWWDNAASPTINDGEFYTTSTANDYFTILLGKGTTSTSGLYIDNLKIRKYITNEPNLSYGTAQHQRRIPQFIG